MRSYDEAGEDAEMRKWQRVVGHVTIKVPLPRGNGKPLMFLKQRTD